MVEIKSKFTYFIGLFFKIFSNQTSVGDLQYPQLLMLHSTRFARLLTVFRKFFNYPFMSETLQFLFTCFRTESNTFTAAEGCFEYRGLLILKLKTVRIFVLVLPFAFSIFSSGIFACLPCIFFIIQFNFFQLRVLILCLF